MEGIGARLIGGANFTPMEIEIAIAIRAKTLAGNWPPGLTPET